MKRLHAWLIATALWFQLERLKDTGGWVVMREEDSGDWHVMGHGAVFGMDRDTGRFDNREDARKFCYYWATIDPGYDATYYVTHDSLLSTELPDHY